MTEQQVLFDVQNHIAEITLNRPEALNALSPTMRQQLWEALDRVEQDPEIRVAVITGAGRAFCAGGDVKSMRQRGEDLAASGRLKVEALRELGRRMPVRIASMDKPVIAAINGAAAGWGCDLAVACDFRIASDQAKFSEAFVKRGLLPDGGSTWTLPRLIGKDQALRLILTGDLIDAREAQRIGLVTEVVPAAELMERTREFAGQIARNAPLAVQLAKRAVAEGANLSFAQAMDQIAAFLGILRTTQDHREGVQAFLEKRDPRFTGE
ncbi:MAG TPA: enoyl-CoA hydratase-related protein [Dehalococcoidia bacterium]|nr:enoyl-CoA hydratase-related protein [Dehalococcoidia bacterium]